MAKTTRKTVKTTTNISTVVTMTKSGKKSVQRAPAPTERALDVFTPPSQTDVNGSYTGRPMHEKEKPVQDADDL